MLIGSASGKKTVDDADDKAISKLGTTYGVLRRLGFSEERVEECLRSFSGIDIEEAYDWVCEVTHLHQSRLMPYLSSISTATKLSFSSTRVRLLTTSAHNHPLILYQKQLPSRLSPRRRMPTTRAPRARLGPLRNF